MTEKTRVLYLDVDDTLLVWTNRALGFAAPRATEFVQWALEHFEVRWLTMWCPSGRMREAGCKELSYRFNYTITPEQFASIRNPRNFVGLKTEGIDFDDPRPWVWVEDGILPKEKIVLQDRGLVHNFYPAHVTRNIVELQSAWRKIAKRFELPSPPNPYHTTIQFPDKILTDEEMVKEFRSGKMENHDADRPPALDLPTGWKW